jgi:hypothetical protein
VLVFLVSSKKQYSPFFMRDSFNSSLGPFWLGLKSRMSELGFMMFLLYFDCASLRIVTPKLGFSPIVGVVNSF